MLFDIYLYTKGKRAVVGRENEEMALDGIVILAF
jgi:hypothetical protein